MGNPSTAGESVHPAELLEKVEADGFAVVSSCSNEETVRRLGSGVSDSSYGMRNLLAAPIVRTQRNGLGAVSRGRARNATIPAVVAELSPI